MTIADDLASDDRRAALKALQAKLAADLLAAEPNAVAAIANQLRQVLKELSAFTTEEGESPADEIAKRRADRIANADPASRPARKSK
jgi:hypothetical protein